MLVHLNCPQVAPRFTDILCSFFSPMTVDEWIFLTHIKACVSHSSVRWSSIIVQKYEKRLNYPVVIIMIMVEMKSVVSDWRLFSHFKWSLFSTFGMKTQIWSNLIDWQSWSSWKSETNYSLWSGDDEFRTLTAWGVKLLGHFTKIKNCTQNMVHCLHKTRMQSFASKPCLQRTVLWSVM